MRITYTNNRVQKNFNDYVEMKKKIPADWVRNIKKHIDRLHAADTFGDFLMLGLGHPEPLKGRDAGKYSIHITGNVRLIIRPCAKGKAALTCEEVVIEGVVDYHGEKQTWYIP